MTQMPADLEMLECLNDTQAGKESQEDLGCTHHLVSPDRRFGLELSAISHLQCTRAAARKEVGDLFPGEILALLQFHQ